MRLSAIDIKKQEFKKSMRGFDVAEVEAYLRCGILAHGLVLAKCSDCG